MQNRLWNRQNNIISSAYSNNMFSFACVAGEVYPTTGLLDSKKEHKYNRRYRC